MKRTARYATRSLNRGKRHMLRSWMDAFGGLKDVALHTLHKTKTRHYRDGDWQTLRNEMKPRHAKGVLAHLQGQAVKDAVLTMRRCAIALTQNEGVRCFKPEQRHGALWILRSYADIGALLRGKARMPEVKVAVKQRKEVVRFVRRLPRRVSAKRRAYTGNGAWRSTARSSRKTAFANAW